MKSPIKFEDSHSFDKNDHYIIPNEEPLVIRDFLKYLPVRRAAGICSAGEIGFFSMLPSVKEELILIDHSYRSLSVAMRKYLLFYHYGWKETVRLLTLDGNAEELESILVKLQKQLPKVIQDKDLPAFTLGTYVDRYGRTQAAAKPNKRLTYGVLEMWNTLTEYELKKACEKLDLVTFVHGDITDLIERGPFDLLYISNIFGHNGRSMRSPEHEKVKQVVKSGGYILEAGNAGASRLGTVVREHKGLHSSWLYKLYQI